MTIDILPDDVLLEMFDYYQHEALELDDIEGWQTLVHVSRKWRWVVFDSPRRLNLQLLCSERTHTRETLIIWPPLPIVIMVSGYNLSGCNEDDIIAAFEHHDRVREIDLSGVPSSLLEKLLAATQEPFPALTTLEISAEDDKAATIPDSFLGGFAPNLKTLRLNRIPFPFPALRKLFSSTTDLVTLNLFEIPHSGYFSPEAMVTCLPALTSLETLRLGFQSPRSRPYHENRRPHPSTRTLLPALRWLTFTGVSEYLEDLVARIDVPLLDSLDMTFFHQLIFDTPQLTELISHSGRRQKDESLNEARVFFSNERVLVWLSEPIDSGLEVGVLCRQSDWQLSAAAQVCSSSFPQAFIPTVEHLYIRETRSLLWWQDDIESSQWLELLHPFTGVKDLFLSQIFASHVAPVLQELIFEGGNGVLPSLQTIHLEGLQPSGVVPKAVEQLVTTRHISGHSIAVIPWDGF